MSLKTWKDEFFSKIRVRMTWKQAVEHSLKKWIGLRKRNLNKHGVTHEGGCLGDSKDLFLVDADSCALCVKSLNNAGRLICEACPLYKVLGRECDKPNDFGIYQDFTQRNDPEPMIKALRKALRLVSKKNWRKK